MVILGIVGWWGMFVRGVGVLVGRGRKGRNSRVNKRNRNRRSLCIPIKRRDILKAHH